MLAAVERVQGAPPIGDWRPILSPTADLRSVELCAVSGMAPGAGCRTRISEWVPVGAHLDTCTWHNAGRPGETFWPDAYRHWARDQGFAVNPQPHVRPTGELRRIAAANTGSDDGQAVRIVAPLAGAVYLIDPTLRREFQSLPLRAAGAAPGALQWFVDDSLVAVASADETARWPLERGAHDIRVRDASGATAHARVVIR